MRKKELALLIKNKFSIPLSTANKVVSIFFDSISEALEKGQEVQLRGFGSFRLRERKERMGRNPKTGEKVRIAAKKVPYFKQGKEIYHSLKRKA